MQTIYVPKNRAREYAALAINLFNGCSHGCKYCWVPQVKHVSREQHAQPHLRAEPEIFLAALKKELDKGKYTGQVLLCFTTDPYTTFKDAKESYKAEVTRAGVIDMLHEHGLGVCLLTKAGTDALKDRGRLIIGKDTYAATLTFLDQEESIKWEPHAALPSDRLQALWAFHIKLKVPTWVSLEPVIYPQQSLEIINITHSYVDVFKVGTLNYDPWAKTIDWPAFAWQVIEKLEFYGYRRIYDPDEAIQGRADNRLYYIKRDLAKYLEGDINAQRGP